jgi:hypothetical protein
MLNAEALLSRRPVIAAPAAMRGFDMREIEREIRAHPPSAAEHTGRAA